VLQRIAGNGPRGRKENRAPADAIAELRGHTCLGPELSFYYTLSRPLCKVAPSQLDVASRLILAALWSARQ
jgi:hypothetical protein